DGGEPQVLVVGVAGEVEAEHVLYTRIVRHVVQPRGLHPALRFGGDVGLEVGEKITAGHDEAAVPRHTVAVGEGGAATGDDGLLRIHAAEYRCDHRVGGGVLGRLRGGCAFEETRHHGGDHFDVPDLLGGDVHDHVLVLPGHSTVPALEQVLHGHGHLAVRS